MGELINIDDYKNKKAKIHTDECSETNEIFKFTKEKVYDFLNSKSIFPEDIKEFFEIPKEHKKISNKVKKARKRNRINNSK